MKRILAALFLILSLTAPALAGLDPEASVEAHAHLFMSKGLTWLFRGDFDGPLRAKGWNDRFGSQANPETVERSKIAVLVIAVYAHPLFSLSLRDSIRDQLDGADHFVATHPNWIIARSATEARQALSQGKRVIILAIEGASKILENDADIAEFINRRGVRIVNLLHFTDDEFGGVAFLRGFRALASPLAWLRQIFRAPGADGVILNDEGLTERGKQFAQTLINHGVWLDLAHSSDLSQRDLIPMLEKAGQPLLYTHTVLRRYHHAERGISDWQLQEVRKSHGIVGLMPSEEMLDGTPVPPTTCRGSVHALAVQYKEVAATIGADSIVMGTDYNGGIPHLMPSCKTGTSLDHEGFWNIGQTPDLWQALRKVGAPVPEPLSITVERFISAWEQVSK